ncbi:hypothetical protein SAMN05443572_106164 [Myxococcus fulvus]|uniref:Uncharacterized protein n=1 Tax=Myxococcus fulvus TaxID=33 RepID=A0ABY1CLH4_MYXFU|nr:hypothetical protein SAMN05443572_106164 [Myxococcus fulvus]
MNPLPRAGQARTTSQTRRERTNHRVPPDWENM